MRLVQPREFGAEHVELAALQLLQQPPIDGAHQLGSNHGAAVLGRQRLLGEPVKMFRARRHAGGELVKAFGIFVPENFRLGDVEFF